MDAGLFARLRAAAGETWPAYTRHDFVLRLARGDLPEAAFRRYLVQDYLFLMHFARAWGLAIYKSDTRRDAPGAQPGRRDARHGSRPAHRILPRLGPSSSDERRAEALETIAYTRFVLDRGLPATGSRLEVALAPCIVGCRDRRRADGRPGDPARAATLSRMARCAGADYQGLAREAVAALDEQFARRGGEGRFPALAAAFASATRLEADFWQMGLDASRNHAR